MFNIDSVSDEKDENSICEGKDIIKDHDILIKKEVYPFIQYPFYNYNLLNNLKYPSIKEIQDIFISQNNLNNEGELEKKGNLSLFLSPQTFFNIKKYEKRGKVSLGRKKNEHLSSDFDNVERKIQVHYLSFVIDFSNDALKAEFGKNTLYNFKQIDYQIKKIINHKFVNKLHSLNIKELLKMDISPKIKHYSKLININTLEKVCKESKFLDNFFNLKYLDFFNRFYFLEGKFINRINFEGKDIVLSKKTKPFYYLLKKNENHKKKIIECAKSIYFYGYDSLIGINSFKTVKKNIKNVIELKE